MSLQLDVYNWQSGHILCFVSKPDTGPVVLEVEVDRNAVGQDILEKTCEAIGTIEKDYFGLQVCPPKREPFWMNLRNRVVGQISGQPPCRLRLRVKYFVQPHLLLQDSTRQIFFCQLRQDIIDGKLTIPPNKTPQLAAYLLQFEHGNYSMNDSLGLCSSLKFGDTVFSEEDIQNIVEAYKDLEGLPQSKVTYFFLKEASERSTTVNLRDPPIVVCNPSIVDIVEAYKDLEGLPQSKVTYFFLKEASELPSYGTEVFMGKIEIPHPHGSNLGPVDATDILIRIGPFGLEIVEEKSDEVRRIPFTAVQLATHSGKAIDIDTVQDDGSICTLVFRMNSEKTSNAVYRCITEMLAFFTWETIHSSVMHQYSRDFKGHLLALFRPDVADQGKQYVFDVQRTWREAYDLARRTLYKRNLRASDIAVASPSVQKSKTTEPERTHEVEILRERLTVICDALTCRVCMDNEINTVFWTCGHQVCCNECATQCQACPVCRHEIGKIQVVFPNVARDFVITGNMDSSASGGSSPTNSTSRSQTPTHVSLTAENLPPLPPDTIVTQTETISHV